jgi:hypothetical protein
MKKKMPAKKMPMKPMMPKKEMENMMKQMGQMMQKEHDKMNIHKKPEK